ncbi:hypothetical protein DPU24_25545 [Salmonella enterica subsp. enterica serovar Oranienburg]|nr:hypothetical protein [Salmonella enterica subsp. enterica serovar Oranienburg]HAK8204832.1 hypothetical protein [Salmonella enterica]
MRTNGMKILTVAALLGCSVAAVPAFASVSQGPFDVQTYRLSTGNNSHAEATTVNLYSNVHDSQFSLTTKYAAQLNSSHSGLDSSINYGHVYAAAAYWQAKSNMSYNVYVTRDSDNANITTYIRVDDSEPGPDMAKYNISDGKPFSVNASIGGVSGQSSVTTKFGIVDFVVDGMVPAGNHSFTVTVNGWVA